MYARIGTFDIRPEQLDAVLAFMRQQAPRAFSAHAGFLGYQVLVDRQRGRIVGISRWTTRAALEASTVSARPLIQRVAELGGVLAGEPQILEEAFDEGPVAT